MKILFLDIDGVLNSTEFNDTVVRDVLICDPKTIDPKNCKIVQSLIEKHSDLLIVISSTWRKYLKIDQLKSVLQDKGIDSSRIIEYTPVIHNKPRGAEIMQWILLQSIKSNFPVTSIAILDDDSDMSSLSEYLVQTKIETGITEDDLYKIEEKFKKPIPF